MSLGAGTKGTFVGTGTITPKTPPGVVTIEILKFLMDIKFGDISVSTGDPDDAGKFNLTVSGFNPTLPSICNGQQDYLARNIGGLRVIPEIHNPGKPVQDGTPSNKFSVATIPIKVSVASKTEHVGEATSGNTHFVGVTVKLDYEYDGITNQANFNYVGEWVGGYNGDGKFVDSGRIGLSNSNTRLERTTSFYDANGHAEPFNGTTYEFQSRVRTFSSKNPGAPRRYYQQFTYLNSAISDTTAYQPGESTLSVPAAVGTSRFVISASYFTFEINNFYTETWFAGIFLTKKYYLAVDRTTTLMPADWKASGLLPGLPARTYVRIGYFEWLN